MVVDKHVSKCSRKRTLVCEEGNLQLLYLSHVIIIILFGASEDVLLLLLLLLVLLWCYFRHWNFARFFISLIKFIDINFEHSNLVLKFLFHCMVASLYPTRFFNWTKETASGKCKLESLSFQKVVCSLKERLTWQ